MTKKKFRARAKDTVTKLSNPKDVLMKKGEWFYFTLEQLAIHLWYSYLCWNTLGQFTGLLDKNGKEIYEGDICRNEYGWIGSVVFDSDVPVLQVSKFTGWWWKCREKRDGKFPFHIDKKIEVIGNIHDNPHLLAKGEDDGEEK